MVGRQDAACSAHVLHHEAWMTVEVLAEMACDQPHPLVVVGPGIEADDELDLLAAIELLRRLGAQLLRDGQQGRCAKHQPEQSLPHISSPAGAATLALSGL